MIAKKRLINLGLMASLFSPYAFSEITVNLPSQSGVTQIEENHVGLSNLISARRKSDLDIKQSTIDVKGNKVVLQNDPANAARYRLLLTPDHEIEVYAAPADNIIVDVQSLTPFVYTISGTPLMEGISEIATATLPLEDRQRALRNSDMEPSREEMMQLYGEYLNLLRSYIENNPQTEAVNFALLSLDDEGFEDKFVGLTETQKQSMLYPFVLKRYSQLQNQKKQLEKQEAMQSGTVVAPDFSLDNLKGEKVSLAQFRGKWVILDFWGSWCIWCIKGFPELKEAYQKYNGQLEIVGVDCNETKAAWKAGVEKYQLPWVNVYCPEGNPLLAEYGVQGFPTKAIIDPEGIIRNVTVGHDPDFFKKLDQLMSESK